MFSIFWNNSYIGTQNVTNINLWKGSVRERGKEKTNFLLVKKIQEHCMQKMLKESCPHKEEIDGWVEEVIKNGL